MDLQKKYKVKVLTYRGRPVNEFMLDQGIYTTPHPVIHHDEELTVTKFIRDNEFVRKVMNVGIRESSYIQNLSKCKFETATLILNTMDDTNPDNIDTERPEPPTEDEG